MKQKKLHNYLLLNLLFAFFLSVGIHELLSHSAVGRLNHDTVAQEGFRQQVLNKKITDYIQHTKDPGRSLGLYWLETDFGTEKTNISYDEKAFQTAQKKWEKREGWEEYMAQCRGIWNDLRYFPIPEPVKGEKAEMTYDNSWMFERNYGGKRGHEGTDIMPPENKRGYYPIVSMTDGVVRHKGWLEQGGWRLGIVAPGGTYFYYAHMDSYSDIEVGDTVSAGDLLGYMGDTGYSKTEGTTGNFPVHLHLGIYLFHEDEEISVNPYWALKYLENRKIKCVYSR